MDAAARGDPVVEREARSRPSGRRPARCPRSPGGLRGRASTGRSRPRRGCRPDPRSTATSRSDSPRRRTRWTGRASSTSFAEHDARRSARLAGRGEHAVPDRPGEPRRERLDASVVDLDRLVADRVEQAATRRVEPVQDRHGRARRSRHRARAARTASVRPAAARSPRSPSRASGRRSGAARGR